MPSTVSALQENELFRKLLGEEVVKSNSPIEIVGIELSGEGAFSRVYRVSLKDENGFFYQIALKVAREKADISDVTKSYQQYLLEGASKQLPGVMKSMGVFGITEEGSVEVLNASDETVRERLFQIVFEIQQVLPEQATQLLEILGTLGLETIQDGRTAEGHITESHTANIENIYKQVISILADIHQSPVDRGTLESDYAAYQDGLEHVITDSSRLDGVAKDLQEGSVLADQYHKIRERMVRLSRLLAQHFPHRLANIHADAWASNFFVGGENNQTVYCIDPGTAPYGDPANDVVFALADLVFVDVNKNVAAQNINFGGEQTDLAVGLLEEYQNLSQMTESQKEELRTVMPLFYGFKAFVSAKFDAQKSEEQQALLTSSAIGALDIAISEIEDGRYFNFSFEDLNLYSAHGKTIS